MNNIIEHLRKQVVTELLNLGTVNNAWESWHNKIVEILGETINVNGLLNLGNHLREIFITTGGEGRTQASLSGGGTAWESLVCWYLNLCTIGSRVVAIKKFSQVPESIKDALAVNYENFTCTTESDIIVLVFPNENEFVGDIANLELRDEDGNTIPIMRRSKVNVKKILDRLADIYFSSIEVGIIQCKTNWNDNAQIPMLWDMIYNSNGFENRNITIGRNGYSMKHLQRFTYSFVTVPSNNPNNYLSSHLSVKRVTSISGGNYWGLPNVNQVARSVKEIFNNNFQTGFSPNIRNVLAGNIGSLGTSFNYFGLS